MKRMRRWRDGMTPWPTKWRRHCASSSASSDALLLQRFAAADPRNLAALQQLQQQEAKNAPSSLHSVYVPRFGRMEAPVEAYRIFHSTTNKMRFVCPFCSLSPSANVTFAAPELTRHLDNWHAMQCIAQHELAPYNDAVIKDIRNGNIGPCSTCVSAAPQGQPSSLQSDDRIFIVFDAANVEHQAQKEFYDMLRSRHLGEFFARHPTTLVAVHELFLTTTMSLYSLMAHFVSQCHESAAYVLYGVPRSEAGDLIVADVCHEMLFPQVGEPAQNRCVVVCTVDRQQKAALQQRFSGCNLKVTANLTLHGLCAVLEEAQRSLR